MKTFQDVDRMLGRLEDMGAVHNLGTGSAEGMDAQLHAANVRLPAWLRAWLLKVNGVALLHAELYSVGPGGKTKSGLGLYSNMNMHYWENGLFPVGGDISGNDYVIELSKVQKDWCSPVYFADSAEEWRPAFVVASDFERFLWFVLNRHLSPSEPWVFNEQYVVENDPGILDVKGTKPWEA
jgi:hypothetical protein